MQMNKEHFILKACQLGIIKFGNFTLKSGIQSPFYVDLRPLASSPELLKELSKLLLNLLQDSDFELICGVPYAALPMATAASLESGIPLIIKRKEAKGYGTKKMLEGIFHDGQTCVLIEDVITSGKSLVETIDEIEKEHLKVRDIAVVLDREQGGIALLKDKGYRVHSLFSIKEVIDILYKYGQLAEEEVLRIKGFLAGNLEVKTEAKKRLKYEEKLALQHHSAGKKLLETALQKKSNLIASIDVTQASEILNLAEKVGDSVVAVKLHSDIISDFSDMFISELKKIAKNKNFLLFEDRKFADIGNTQQLQFEKGIYHISEWADMITSHVIAGAESLKIFGETGVVVIAEMSSKGTLTDEHYKNQAVALSEKAENVIGCVAQSQMPDSLLLFTPGVNLTSTGDAKGQQFNTPERVMTEYHTDFIIVGRGIYASANPKDASEKYQKAGWNAYLHLIEN